MSEENPQEQGGGLEGLRAECLQVDQKNNLGAPGAPVAPEVAQVLQVDRRQEAALIIGLAGPLLAMVVPGLKDAPAQEWQALHEPVAELLAHYSVNVPALLSSPWAKLAFAASPLIMRAVNAWGEAEKKPGPEGAPGGDVAPGAPGPGAGDGGQ